jgi:hypothetical protein
MVSPKTIFALSWRAAALCLFSAVTGACCGNLTHHHPAPTLLGDMHHVHSPYYSCPGCKELVPKHLPHRCGHPVELPFFGYEATCWAPWPTGWVGCPPIVEQRYPMPCPPPCPLPEMTPPFATPGAPMFEPVPSHLIPHPTPAARAPQRIESDEPPAPPMPESDLDEPPTEDDASSFGIRPLDLSFRGAEIEPNPPAPAAPVAAPVNSAFSSAPRPEAPRDLAPPAIAREERPLRPGRGLRSTLRAARDFSPPEMQPRAEAAPSIAAAPEIVERAEMTAAAPAAPPIPAAPPVRSFAASPEATKPLETSLPVETATPAETAKVVEAKPIERALVVEATPTLETAARDEGEAVQFAVDDTQAAPRDDAGASQAPGAVTVEYVQPPLWLAGTPQSRERRPAASVRTTQKSAEASDARQTIVELVTHLISARRDDNRPARLR